MFKQVSDVATSTLGPTVSNMVDFISVIGGFRKLDIPVESTKIKCAICDGNNHITPYLDMTKGNQRVRICTERNCVTHSKENLIKATTIQPTHQRAVPWALFCEINQIGDIHKDVRYENIIQSADDMMKIKEFMNSPKRPILLLAGKPGTGKTFASIGLCEKFTRHSTSCVFTTQKRMMNDWTDTFKMDRISSYIQRVTECNLLVIDDFGTAVMTPAFMSFFMDLVNSRMQWTKRKTVISTNLDANELSKTCGDSLMDRMRTGITINFKDNNSRR